MVGILSERGVDYCRDDTTAEIPKHWQRFEYKAVSTTKAIYINHIWCDNVKSLEYLCKIWSHSKFWKYWPVGGWQVPQ